MGTNCRAQSLRGLSSSELQRYDTCPPSPDQYSPGNANSLIALNLAPEFVTRENFPLPDDLHALLRKVSQDLHRGKGLAVLRGLPNNYSDEDTIIMYAGVLSHIGSKRSTNSFGMALEHIRDASLQPKPAQLDDNAQLDPAKKNNGMSFHTDRFFADILAFFVRGKAAEGGDQQFASFWSVFNELRASDPDALKGLTSDLIWPPRPDEVHGLPVIEPMVLHSQGKVISQIIWAPFLGNPEYLTPGLKRALGAVNRSARAHSITVESQPGDIQLLNNFAVMHSRNGFRDSQTQRRHLMRMGVRDEDEAWQLPDFAEEKLAARFAVDPASQIMPVIDFDPWEITGTNTLNHG